jgi:hypothetical protein
LVEDPPEWDLASTWPYRLLIAAALDVGAWIRQPIDSTKVCEIGGIA